MGKFRLRLPSLDGRTTRDILFFPLIGGTHGTCSFFSLEKGKLSFLFLSLFSLLHLVLCLTGWKFWQNGFFIHFFSMELTIFFLLTISLVIHWLLIVILTKHVHGKVQRTMSLFLETWKSVLYENSSALRCPRVLFLWLINLIPVAFRIGPPVASSARRRKIFQQKKPKPINQSINQSINQITNQPINQSIDWSINQSNNQSINQSINRTSKRTVPSPQRCELNPPRHLPETLPFGCRYSGCVALDPWIYLERPLLLWPRLRDDLEIPCKNDIFSWTQNLNR